MEINVKVSVDLSEGTKNFILQLLNGFTDPGYSAPPESPKDEKPAAPKAEKKLKKVETPAPEQPKQEIKPAEEGQAIAASAVVNDAPVQVTQEAIKKSLTPETKPADDGKEWTLEEVRAIVTGETTKGFRDDVKNFMREKWSSPSLPALDSRPDKQACYRELIAYVNSLAAHAKTA